MKIKIISIAILILLFACTNSTSPEYPKRYPDKDEHGYCTFRVDGKLWYPKSEVTWITPSGSHQIELGKSERYDNSIFIRFIAKNIKTNSLIDLNLDSITHIGKQNIITSNKVGYRYFYFNYNEISYNKVITEKSWIDIESLDIDTLLNDVHADVMDLPIKASFHIEAFNNYGDTIIIDDGYLYMIPLYYYDY